MKVILLISFFILAAQAGPIEDLKPGCWYEVHNSHLEDCPDRPTSAQYSWLRETRFNDIIDSWAGGAFDTKRDRLLIGPGGGHRSYNGNEVYAFDLNTFAWSRLTDPDPATRTVDNNPDECPESDTLPAAMHTYDGVEYMANVDRFAALGANCTPRTLALNFDTRTWEVWPIDAIGHPTGRVSAYDPATGSLWAHGCYNQGKLGQYLPSRGTWTYGPSEYLEIYGTAAIDPGRRLMVLAGSAGGLRQFRVWNLNTPAAYSTSPATTGARDLETSASPGFVFDPASDKFVAWRGGADVYTLDPDTWAWARVSPAAANTVIPTAANPAGTWGRWRYSPNKNVFVAYNRVSENVYIYRLTPDASVSETPAISAQFMQVFPNPARAGEKVRFSVSASIEVFNLAGQRVFTGATAWNTAGMPAGIYLARTRLNGGTASRKILIQD